MAKKFAKLSKFLCALIALSLCLGVFTACQSQEGEDAQSGIVMPKRDGDYDLKILAFGNSFSEDSLAYLWQIFNDAGYDVLIGHMYIGGCFLDYHWENMSTGTAAYKYLKSTKGTFSETANVAPLTALQDEQWDIITVQQSSGLSGDFSSFANIGNIVNYINENKTNPDAKLYWHMTWAYKEGFEDERFIAYNNDQMTMYNAIVATTQSMLAENPAFVGVIPSGTSMQNLRAYGTSAEITRDGYHMSLDVGRYTAALTWYAALSGNSVESIDWVPGGVKRLDALGATIAENLPQIKKAVTNAVTSPFAVTEAG